jgi:hypothetical protein
MELSLLLKLAFGLIVVLGILVFLLVVSSKSKKAQSAEILGVVEKEPRESKPATDLPTLVNIINNQKSTSKELHAALDLIMKHHGDIHPKIGSNMHPEAEIYMKILFSICRHPNTNKDIILGFNRALERKNPDYKIEINEAIRNGLNARES